MHMLACLIERRIVLCMKRRMHLVRAMDELVEGHSPRAARRLPPIKRLEDGSHLLLRRLPPVEEAPCELYHLGRVKVPIPIRVEGLEERSLYVYLYYFS